MKKQTWKRLLSGILIVVMLVTILPAPALAAVGELLGNSAVENAALLEALKAAYGDDADTYYAVLGEYGLLDEDGNLITDEKIVMDGQEYTLDEMEALLAAPETDLEKVVEVDGQHLTLDNLQKIIEIERYLAYVQASYFTEQELTPEQEESFYDLADAWANGQVRVMSAAVPEGVGPAGVDHTVIASVGISGLNYTVTLSKAQSKDVTFSWRAVGGSAAVSGGGSVTIAAGDTEGSFAVPAPSLAEKFKGSATYLVQIYDLKNALFAGGVTRWEQQAAITGSDSFKYSGTATGKLSYASGTTNAYYYDYAYFSMAGSKSDSGGDSAVKTKYEANTSEERASETLSVKDLSAGTYQRTVSFSPSGNGTFTRRTDSKYWKFEHMNLGGKEENTPAVYQFTIGGTAQGNAVTLTGLRDGDSVTVPKNEKVSTSALSGGGTISYALGVKTLVAYYKNSVSTMNYGYDEKLYFIPAFSIPISLNVQETTSTTGVTLSATEGEYYPGQNVPITAVFGFPMKIDGKLKISVNNKILTPVETGAVGKVCTFLYPVQEKDGTSLVLTNDNSANNITGTGANEKTITAKVSNAAGSNIGTASLKTPDRDRAFTDFSVELKTDAADKPYLVASVQLSSDESYTNWVLNELVGDSGLTSLQVMTDQTGEELFSFLPDDINSPQKLIVTIPLEYNTSPAELPGMLDFFLDGEVMMGKARGFSVPSTKPIEAQALSPVLTVAPAGGAGADYKPGDTVPLIYAQQDNALTLDFGLSGSDYTWGDKTKLSYFEGGAAKDPSAHFAWKSSDTAVAAVTVDDSGRAVITPTGRAGTVEFTLTALNGGMADAESAAITVSFAVGQDPFLLIPASGKALSIREGQDASINWSSNICQKNETAGEEGAFVPTTFNVAVSYTAEGETMTAVLPDAVLEKLTTSEGGGIISSVTLPWEGVLKEIYEAGARIATVEVSVTYLGKTYGTWYDENQAKQADNATATIKMTSQPAAITLYQPEGGLFQTDGGTGRELALSWGVEHLDDQGGGQFELYVASTNPDFGENGILTVEGLETAGDGGYTLTIPAVVLTEDPASYRDTYNITVKAKNAAESIWTYSSYVMYVYSQEALNILLDGVRADGSYEMSNVDGIAEKWGEGGEAGSEAIVALRRDIALKNVISINYGEYAWAGLADQIAWNSSDSSVATINYQQGTLYENIENFSYTSYRPATDFILSGLKDGSTTVSATHVQTGIKETVTVDVETLRDKLYLFQCYPKTATTLTYTVYTNANRRETEQMTLSTNEQGEAAIYAPFGIAGDVYCQSEVLENGETNTYLGTIYHRALVSSEADSTKLQLYPVNTLRLRRAAYAEIFLKNPDGTPYEGGVTFRGGVYREGEYCNQEVLFGLQNKKPILGEGKLGDEGQYASTGADGRLLVTMDISQFKSSAEQEDVQAGEKLYYIFQIEYGAGTDASHYPIFLRVDANLNMDDVAATGDSIVAWTENEGGAKPFIAAQTMQYSEKATASVASVRESTGHIGPSTTFPSAWLTTTVMWWGDEADETGERENTVTLLDNTNKAIPGQSGEKVVYPFSDMAYTEHVTLLNSANMTAWGVEKGQSRSLTAALSRDGVQNDLTIALPFRVVNMIGASQAEESSVLGDALTDIKNNLNAKADARNGADEMTLDGMRLISDGATYDSSQDTFAVRLFATSDPMVFRAFFCLNVGNMESGGNVTGVYPNYENMEEMAFAQTSSASQMGDLGLFPTPLDIYDMAKGRYGDKRAEEIMNADKGKAISSFNADLGGYFEADIIYDEENQEWECRPISGGFHAGGGVNFTWNFNAIVGVVPVTTSLTLGGTIELSMDMQQGNYYSIKGGADQVTDLPGYKDMSGNRINAEAESLDHTTGTANDYLTQLRLFFYIRTFAGLGFDLSVVAFKIGVFGQLNIDMNFAWLNRGYLKDSDKLSAVGPAGSRKDSVMDGQELYVTGSTGIEFMFKLAFISYEHVFCSVGFKLGGTLNDMDDIDEIWAANKTINNRPVQKLTMPNGQVMYSVDLGAQLESRDYVDIADQEWVGGEPMVSTFALDADQNETLAKALQTGAYLYAGPVLSDDGAMMLYLSDRESGDTEGAKSVTNTRVAYSVKDAGQFQEGTRIGAAQDVDEGYGDTSVKIAGGNGNYAAVWVRQMENITPEQTAGGGASLSEGQQMLQVNSSEIVAGIYGNGSWELHQLTSNSTPDLAPVVASSGTRTVVAWREVSSTSVDSLTSFDQQDAIRFSVYDGTDWSKAQTLYDGAGTGAVVKGIETAMLSDGTAAVAYTLDMDASDGSNTDWETVLAIIPGESGSGAGLSSEDAVRTFRLTTDKNLDENPQIATASFDDGTERFVVAWHTQRPIGNGGGAESDIRLAVMDRNGVSYEKMPESLGKAAEGTGAAIGSNFRFAKNADAIENLAILWVDSVSAGASEETGDSLSSAIVAGYNNIGYDVLKAVKFVRTGGVFTVSGMVEVAEMEKGTLIDSFDAYMDNGSVKSVLLGTNYSSGAGTRTVEISDGGVSSTATLALPIPVSGMYTATAQFENRIELSALMLEYEKLYPNSNIDVQFTVRNSGKDAVTKLEIFSEGGMEPVYTSGDAKLNLLPNQDMTVTASFPTGDRIANTEYTIRACFEGDDNPVELSDTLYLDIPDVGVSKLEVTKEADGLRTLRYSLYNALSAKLGDADDGWQVMVGFYEDQGCTIPLEDESGAPLVKQISSKTDLAMIDAGGYSSEVTLPVGAYMAASGAAQEIPDGGIKVYVKAWIETPVNAMSRAVEYDAVSEYFNANNGALMTVSNLAVRRGADVTIQTEIDNSGEGTKATVKVQYNKLTGTTSGNLIATLLDEKGEPIEKLQSYTEENGLLELSNEGTAERVFNFSKKGASVRVEFSDLILNEDNVELDHIVLTGAEVTYDEETKTYTATGANLASGVLEIAPKDPQNARITFNKEAYDVNTAITIRLPYGTVEWTIEVENGEEKAEYKLVLVNINTAISGSGIVYPVNLPEKIEHGSVTVSPEKATAGQVVSITAKPDDKYKAGTVTVTGADGKTVTVTDKGNGVYTFVMPGGEVAVEVGFVLKSKWVNPFRDVPENAWYYDAVEYVHTLGLMAGTGNTTFDPDAATTRGMIVTILWRLEESPAVNYNMDFTDVDSGAYYAMAVRWAAANGIVNGYGNGKFGPNDAITREQMAAILYRFAQFKGYDAAGRADLSGYSDAGSISGYAADAMSWAVAEGLVNGTGGSALTPGGFATRCQTAAILMRYLENVSE